MSVSECVRLINEEDRRVHEALSGAHAALTALITAAEPGFAAGGRLIYVGAGTSGRLGVLDASEAPPTFHVEPGRVVGIIAGGRDALVRSSEGLEDNPAGAHEELANLGINERDTVIGVAAGGTTPFVLGSLDIAKREAPCTTGLITSSRIERPPHADHLVFLDTGPEVIAGSTRMKAGTAAKLALNTISTTLMVRTGRVYRNLMVDLRATNDKLRDRAARIITQVTDLERSAAFDVLDRAGGSVKCAILMHRLGVTLAEAKAKLESHGGRLGDILGD
jgi:N-acetylmuramic acid 6-phosphate etherase